MNRQNDCRLVRARRSLTVAFWFTFLGSILASGCADFGSATRTDEPSTLAAPHFALTQAPLVSAGGTAASVLVRMDSVTGETWILNGDPPRWTGVEDELQRVGKYDEKTKQIVWGVQLPDGRDLNELSREELIRYLSATARNGRTVDPKDPLGILDAPTP